MQRFSALAAALVLVFGVAACDSFVEDVDLPIDNIDDSLLNNESQVPFVITGVQTRFSDVVDFIAVLSGGLSDEQIFDQNVPNATFPTFQQIDECDIQFANNSVDGGYDFVNELRFFADNLGERIPEITFTDTELEQEARFTASFYGAVARYYLATYFALAPDQPGGVITTDPNEPGPFVPAPELYSQALQLLDDARASADAYETKLINTLSARIHLFQGNYDDAAAAAANGLAEGDDEFSVPYSSVDPVYWYTQAGVGRSQFVANFRFNQYLEEDPNEVARIPLTPITGVDGETTYYFQGLYPDRTSPMTFASWQENNLILAETALRSGDAAGALELINDVRASHELDALDEATLDVLATERDKELFTSGQRLPDQRRLGLTPDEACDGEWRYLPITQSERNANDNF